MKFLTPARVTLLMLLVVGGLVAAYVGKKLLASEEQVADVRTRTIPMAVGDLQPGTVITEAHIGTATVEESQLEPDMLRTDRVIIGRVVKVPIHANGAFRSSDLYPPGVRPPLPVHDGMRAVTVPVEDASAMVDGLISPGQHVDVHLTIVESSDPRLRGGMTVTLFRAVRVLAINQSQGAAGIGASGNAVTLELTPAETNVMFQAQQRGTITMSYNPKGRDGDEVTISREDRATLEEILNLSPLPQPPEPFVVESYVGSSRGLIQYVNGRRVDDLAVSTTPTVTDDPATP